MAGTVAVTETTHTSVKKVKFVWVSSAGGAADATTTATFDGEIIKVITSPGTGGTQPTDDYDLVLTNSDGVDMLAGQGANRDDTAIESISSGMGGLAAEKLTLGITNAGSAKAGTVLVYIR